jgi:hypothetical protein
LIGLIVEAVKISVSYSLRVENVLEAALFFVGF